LPEQLSALVPAYLPALPRDLMDGRPLRYKHLDQKEFMLYSVGENGLDDNARSDDVLWPKAE